MSNFLQQVAEYYIRKGSDMTKVTFVFPNRRSALFMHKYLKQRAVNPIFKPRMISITYFTHQLSNCAPADNTELIFILYKIYCQILRERGRESQISDFDRFYFWGSIILSDFNDIDASLVNPAEIYNNLKALKEIKSYYLTPEQIEVIRYLWGEEVQLPDEDIFWAHMRDASSKDTEASSKFLNLWEIMHELYERFTEELGRNDTPIAYTGLQSRIAYENIKRMGIEDFHGQHYVFVGFNILSTARTLIFKRLKDLGIADFFWDIASPLVSDDGLSRGSISRHILPLARSFRMPDDFTLQTISPADSDIEIVSVPSAFGQTKVVSKMLDEWVQQWRAEGGEDALSADALVNTAIVLADESLLMPLLYAIPPSIDTINVTMSISYASTPFAALMSSIISMHLRGRKAQMTYYYADVVDVLSHQYITMIAPEAVVAIKEKINKEHLYTIRADELVRDYPQLAFLFAQIADDHDILQVREFIETLVGTLRERLCEVLSLRPGAQYYELTILDGYAKAIDDLCLLVDKYGVTMYEHTFLQMIERTMSLKPVNFAGQPLKGLQIMSIMDTRALDFDNVIMLSANERIFPKRNFSPSLIPTSLRAAYNMPTQEHEESSYAYQFGRLISRAGRVRLLYDSRTGGVTSGEMSRYLAQLLYMHPELNVTQRTVEFKAQSDEVRPIIINKTPDVVKQLQGFRPGGPLKLSASALKTYMSCPLKFYLQYVRNLRADEETLEYIDAASYGSVIHEVVRALYNDHAAGTPQRPVTVNEYLLDKMMHDDIERRALETLNRVYYNNRYRDLSQIPGEGKIVSKIIAEYVKHMLRSEKKLGEYMFYAAEFEEHKTNVWRINDKYTLNFKMSIDRIDLCRGSNPQMPSFRFIDYKTGGDSLTALDLDKVFSDKNCGGIFQLLLYSHAYKALYADNKPVKIKPVIYKFQTIPKDGIVSLRMHRKDIEDYLDADEGEEVTFYQRFEQLIDDIFEEDNRKPFVQTDDTDVCMFCPFCQLCGRYTETDS